jgi:uncharacterized protein (DUF608 family)
MAHLYNQAYTNEHLTRSGFPLGGIGAGMICLEGSGKLAQVSVRHHPRVFFEPLLFSAIHIKGLTNGTRVLEGPTPDWKLGTRWDGGNNYHQSSGNGFYNKTYGMPHFSNAKFTARFPFASVDLSHPDMPVTCQLKAFSPFVPGDSESASLPVASLQYTFTNTSDKSIDAVYSFHAHRDVIACPFKNPQERLMPHVLQEDTGFVITQGAPVDDPAGYGEWGVWCEAPQTTVDSAWFRGGWFDTLTMLMKKITAGDTSPQAAFTEGEPSQGGSLFVPLQLSPGQSQTVRVLLSWYVPVSNVKAGSPGEASCCADDGDCCSPATPSTYRPWYASRFGSGANLRHYWKVKHESFEAKSALFSDAFFASTLPDEILEAASANLSILKSPTVLRQHDGRLWAWEGCHDDSGCCHGSCTHVWNYAQAICHLFPDLERTLRETEFGPSQNAQGKQCFRSNLPITPPSFDFHAASDGQLGGIAKLYREWRISGDTDWLKQLWPAAKQSLEFCIKAWDPDETGMLIEPHHNTYDIEFWGPDGMCTSFYLAALKAASMMAKALGDDHERYDQIYARGKEAMETQLFDGEYFNQQIRWQDLHATPQFTHQNKDRCYSPEAVSILEKEGPKYQYGTGCLSDGILGDWIGRVCGLEPVVDIAKTTSHLQSIFKYNFRESLADHVNPQRCGYGCGDEAGLLLCTWPKGGRLSLPFVYSEEVWTGIEYQVASHLMMSGCVDEGLTIVRAARDRYDGTVRNPFNEIECGHWYARALASYGLLQGITGIRYDAVDQTLTVKPQITGDFACFLSTATGFGLVCVKDNDVTLEVKHGKIDVKHIDYQPCE